MASTGTGRKSSSPKKDKTKSLNSTNYRRGARFEYSVRDRLYDYYGARYVVRAAGSHGVADLVAFFSWGETWFVQCKLDGKLSSKEEEKLFDVCSSCKVQPRLAFKNKEKKVEMKSMDSDMKAWRIENPRGLE